LRRARSSSSSAKPVVRVKMKAARRLLGKQR
jgi:hypothetical protein